MVSEWPRCSNCLSSVTAVEWRYCLSGRAGGHGRAGIHRASLRRTLDADAYAQWVDGVKQLYDRMTAIVVTPTWAKLLDFQRTAPSEVERLVRAKGGPN